MRKRIVCSFLIVFTIVMGISYAFLYSMIYNIRLSDAKNQMYHTIDLIELDNIHSPKLDKYLAETGSRLTIIEMDGKVIFDSNSNPSENHLEREEVQSAIKNGKGEARRYSKTMESDYLYVAEYDKDKDVIYRLSMPFDGVSQSVQSLLPYFSISFLLAIVVALFLSNQMSRVILNPIHEITSRIRHSTNDDIPIKFDAYPYAELQDITQTITEMDQKIRQNLENEKKEKVIRQEFFTNASHELKTPLTSIYGYSELLKSKTIQDPNQQQMCLDQIMKQSAKMSALIKDILTVSKLESNDVRIISKRFSMRKVCQKVLEEIKPLNTLDCEIQLVCPEGEVYANEGYIEMLLMNLVSNALKYNVKNGTVRIVVSFDELNLQLEVRDTGIGISQEDQEHIFKRFYRVDKQRTDSISGTGLGLSIVKHIVNYYKGSINLHSKENFGTCIQVKLPIAVH